jgi:hypothetical protein
VGGIVQQQCGYPVGLIAIEVFSANSTWSGLLDYAHVYLSTIPEFKKRFT